ncbi:hypothetical protein GCM10027064_11950 [Microbacterium petrolearium]
MREEIPPGGGGADSGAADAPRVSPGDRGSIQNVSSQNDLPGVGTRAADGSMEPRPARREDARGAERPSAAQPVDDGRAPRRGSRDSMRGGRAAWWLIPAGLLGAVCVVLFAVSVPEAGLVAWLGIVLEVVLFAAIVAVSLTQPLGGRRSALFASLLGAMAVVGVAIALTIYAMATAA